MDHRTSIGLHVHAKSTKTAAFIRETGEVAGVAAAVVARSSAIHSISIVTAFSIAAEVGGFSRFPGARSFISYPDHARC